MPIEQDHEYQDREDQDREDQDRDSLNPRVDPETMALIRVFREAWISGHPLELEAFLRRHPENAERLRNELEPLVSGHLVDTSQSSPVPPTLGADDEVEARNKDQLIEIGRILGRYRLCREIARGAMGIVFEAEDSLSGRRVAIKVIRPDASVSDDALERFRREGRLASTINHPRCVFVYGAHEDSGVPYLVLELMPGETLRDLVERDGVLDPEDAIRKCLDILNGLMEIHNQGILHRDIKPSNCFVDEDGRVKLGDFGISKSLFTDLSQTAHGTLLGTPLYAAPEQIKGDAVDKRADVYSLCATLYYLLIGRAPFEGNDLAALAAKSATEDPTPPKSHRPGLSRTLDQIIVKGLARNPDSRWHDLADVRRALLGQLPERLSGGGLGARALAFSIDLMPWLILLGLLSSFPRWIGPVITWVCFSIYFATTEFKWGQSLGKRWLRLRVMRSDVIDTASLKQHFLRSLALVLILMGPFWVDRVAGLASPGSSSFVLLGSCVLFWGGQLILMFRSSGYLGLHEILSQTRVLRIPPTKLNSPLNVDKILDSFHSSLHNELNPKLKINHYEATRELTVSGFPVLVGHDSSLDREVWIDRGSANRPPLSETRRSLTRTTRLRWLDAGETDDASYRVFVAPNALPLTDILKRKRRLNWESYRPILEDLARELVAQEEDGTAPSRLLLEQVWINRNGHPILMDLGESPDQKPKIERRLLALDFLEQVSRASLEGQRRRQRHWISAPVPLHARRALDRLSGELLRFESPNEVVGFLQRTELMPTKVHMRHRIGLAVSGLLIGILIASALLTNLDRQTAFYNQLAFYALNSNALAESLQDSSKKIEILDDLNQNESRTWQNTRALADVSQDKIIEGIQDGTLRSEILRLGDQNLECVNAYLNSWLAWPAKHLGSAHMECILKACGEPINANVEMPIKPPQWDQHALAATSSEAPLYRRWIRELSVDQLNQPEHHLFILLAFFVGLSLVTRGGLRFQMSSLAVMTWMGPRASRLRCALRTGLAFSPILILSSASAYTAFNEPLACSQSAWFYAGSWITLALYPVFVLVPLKKSPQDWIAGTIVLPK